RFCRESLGAPSLAVGPPPVLNYSLEGIPRRIDQGKRRTTAMNDWYDAEQQVEKAQELFEQQKWEEALELLRAAVTINPYNSAWQFNIGLTLDEMERYGEAIDAYEQALVLQPDDLEALNHLGVDLSRVGRFAYAIKTFERIETLDATFEPAYCNRIGAYSELGEHEKAEEMFYLARLYKEQCPD